MFVSSTFRDMQAERDQVVPVVFTGLHEGLEPHQIHFVDFDLWCG